MNWLPGNVFYEFCVDFLQTLTSVSARVLSMWDKPLLPNWFISWLDSLPDNMEDFLLDVLRISNWGQLTLEWCTIASLYILVSVLLIKWLWSWVK